MSSAEHPRLQLLEETAVFSKRTVDRGRVVVRTGVEERDETLRAQLEFQDVTVEHVPVGRVVDAVPPTRELDGVTIIPVVEERLVVRTELVLREELHIRRTSRLQPVEQTVRLRRQTVTVERHPPAGTTTNGDDTMAINPFPTSEQTMEDLQTPIWEASGGTQPTQGLQQEGYGGTQQEERLRASYATRGEAQAVVDTLTTAGIGSDARLADHVADADRPAFTLLSVSITQATRAPVLAVLKASRPLEGETQRD